MDDFYNYENDILIKFTNYLPDTMNGKLYCNNLDYFRNLDEKDGVGDQTEGTLSSSEAELKLDGKSNFIFCMTALQPFCKESKAVYKLSDEQKIKFKEMGVNNSITILKPDIFTKKIESVCQENHISCLSYGVYYADKTEDGLKQLKAEKEEFFTNASILEQVIAAAFIKPEKYKWQREFRYLFYNVPENLIDNNHFILDIGPLSDLRDPDGKPIVFPCNNCFKYSI